MTVARTKITLPKVEPFFPPEMADAARRVDKVLAQLAHDASVINVAGAAGLTAHLADHANPHVVTKAQVGLSLVENTALSTWAGSANLTTLGTIGTGVWNATAIAWAKVDKAGSSLADLTTRSAADLSSGVLADARVQQSNVTQHQAALAIAYSQLTGTVPTWNQDTTGSAAKWTTPRNLAGNSVDGSAPVTFANKFIVQGTTDAGLSGAQFLGALGTGIVKNMTTTGVLSIAVAGDFPTLNQNTTGSAATLTNTRTIWGQNFNGSANVSGALSGATTGDFSSTVTVLGNFEAARDTGTQGDIFADATNRKVYVGRLSAVSQLQNFIVQGRTGTKYLDLDLANNAFAYGQSSVTHAWQGASFVFGHTAILATDVTPIFEIVSGLGQNGFASLAFSNDTLGGRFEMGKSRSSTKGTLAVPQASDQIGNMTFLGNDGTNWQQAAQIVVRATALHSGTSSPGQIEFLTTAVGSLGSAIQRFMISDGGHLGMVSAKKFFWDGYLCTGVTWTSGTASSWDLFVNSVNTISSSASAVTLTGDLLFSGATYDIGKSGPATAPRDGFFTRNLTVYNTVVIGNKAAVVAPATNEILYLRHDFGLIAGGREGLLVAPTASITSNMSGYFAGGELSFSVGGSSDNVTSTANWTNATAGLRGYNITMQTRTGSSGTITGAAGLYITSFAKNGSGTITNLYGVYCEAQTAATNNYFLYNAGAAKNVLGSGDTNVGGTLTVVGVTTLATSLTGILRADSGVVSVATGVGAKSLFDHFADVSNGTTVETDLYSDTIAAAQLSGNGQKLFAQYGGTFVGDGTSTQRVRAYFGGTLIFDTGALGVGVTTSSWDMWVTVMRESSTVVRVSVSLTSQLSTFAADATYTKITGLTLTNTQVLKITGTAAGVTGGSNQITASEGFVQWVPAA